MKSILHNSFQIPGARGAIICGDLRFPEGERDLPVIVFCHGFKGFKDWGGWPYMAEELARKRFAVLTFNFSHNGIGEDLVTFSELEKFKENTFSLEVEDLKLVIDALKNRQLAGSDNLDANRLGLIGHSRGGFAALAVAHSERAVKGVATLAAISRPSAVVLEEDAAWRKEGVRYVVNARTGEKLPLGVSLLDDMIQHRDTIQRACQALVVPLLVIHGDQDEAVSVQAARDLSSWAKHSQLQILAEASHTFGIKHPFQGSTPQFDRVIKLMGEFFGEVI